MPKTYLFYDIETTGINPCFDQILQFAAIRTDTELNELERYSIDIKLNCDGVPDPDALLVHQIPIHIQQQGHSEWEAIREIYRLVNTPGTQSGGYNTLQFDDEFLRFGFYRNLLPPYQHQWANQCGRFDLFPMTMLFFLYKNNCIQWPWLEDRVSLKLEHLSTHNQLATGIAHNALVDVEATLALARRFFSERQMFDYALGYFDKIVDKTRIQQLNATKSLLDHYPVGLMIGQTGAQNHFQLPVLGLGSHQIYKNQSLWLRLDQPELQQARLDNLPEHTWVIRKKIGENGWLLPFVSRFTQHLTIERMTIMEENLKWLTSNKNILHAIVHYYQTYTYPIVPEADVESTLYQNGFLSDAEQALCQQFHAASLSQKLSLTRIMPPTLQQLASRIIGRHFPEALTGELLVDFQNYQKAIHPTEGQPPLIDYRRRQRLTPVLALEKIQTLLHDSEITREKKVLLEDLQVYFEKQFDLPHYV
ncbi:MAG: exonuclease domain-containing protein [Gammaproteobacteria bacterium]